MSAELEEVRGTPQASHGSAHSQLSQGNKGQGSPPVPNTPLQRKPVGKSSSQKQLSGGPELPFAGYSVRLNYTEYKKPNPLLPGLLNRLPGKAGDDW